MILSSLLKVLGISIISCLSFAEVDSSSVVHTEDQSTVSVKAPRKDFYNGRWLSEDYIYITFDVDAVHNDEYWNGLKPSDFSYENSMIATNSNLTIRFDFSGSFEDATFDTFDVYFNGTILTSMSFSGSYYEGSYLQWNAEINFVNGYIELNIGQQSSSIYGIYIYHLDEEESAGSGDDMYISTYNTFMHYCIYTSGFYYTIDSVYLNTVVFTNLGRLFETSIPHWNNYLMASSDNDDAFSPCYYEDTGYLWCDLLSIGHTFEFGLGNPTYTGYVFQMGINVGTFDYDIEFAIYNEDYFNEFVSAIELDISNSNQDVVGYNFMFENQFNYNAPYNTDYLSQVVADSGFTSGVSYKQKVINLGYFISNGVLFDEIRLYYKNAYNVYFDDGSGNEPNINTLYGYGYFDYMQYINNSTGYVITVCNRYYGSGVDSHGNFYQTVTLGTNWVNPSYRSLVFLREPSANEKNSLTKFNTTSIDGGYSGYGDMGLTKSFSLINTALTGIASFFNINILPGITLGAIILVPFAVTILLFVIRLFKR